MFESVDDVKRFLLVTAIYFQYNFKEDKDIGSKKIKTLNFINNELEALNVARQFRDNPMHEHYNEMFYMCLALKEILDSCDEKTGIGISGYTSQADLIMFGKKICGDESRTRGTCPMP